MAPPKATSQSRPVPKRRKTPKQQSKKKKKTKEQREYRLTTSEEIINRILWDTDYPEEQFIIGYMDRFLGMMETTIETYLDEAEIPYHRIYYLSLNGTIVWDRNKRMDLFANNKAKTYVIKKQEPSTSFIEEEEEEEEEEKEVNEEEEEEEQGEDKNDLIIFNQKKQRRHYVQYKPQDELETWMAHKNYRELALHKPTHVSQKGGYYHIDVTKTMTFLEKWAASIMATTPFYMEEKRSSVFRLYLDLDFKMTTAKPFPFIASGWLQSIQQFTHQFFMEKLNQFHDQFSSSVLVTESHSEWSDATTKDAVFKSGFRLYFPSIMLDEATLATYVPALTKHLSSTFMDDYQDKPSSWAFTDIIDHELVSHDRARLFGSSKYRRGRFLGREYTAVGVFNEESKFLSLLSSQLESNLIPLLQLTQVRYEGNGSKLYEPHKHRLNNLPVLVFSKYLTKLASVPVCLKKKQLREFFPSL